MKRKNIMKKQAGFTLVELVIVVVLLGLLAVTAIPKFLDLTENAKQANIEGMAGGFATGISLARSQWEAEARPKEGVINKVAYDGVILALTSPTTATATFRPGYVVGLTDADGTLAAFDKTDCVDVWNSILQQPPAITDSIVDLNDFTSFRYLAAATGTTDTATCHYYLKESLSRAADGDWEDPGVLTTIGNSFTYRPANSAVTVYINNNGA